ncbi:MAG: 1-deoxy-D-xylulose-5-phosphate synthase [Planctomycetes bacterium]|nr:1-deoxy-D-xylulose-5-phosphate synthase [Planctomycetota bacterium]
MSKLELMYIEFKFGGIRGNGLICGVTRSKSRRTIYYDNLVLKSLGGQGCLTNYYEETTQEEYWVSHPKKNGEDSLYPEEIYIDENVREEYWRDVRNLPQNISVSKFKSAGKYSRKRPV